MASDMSGWEIAGVIGGLIAAAGTVAGAVFAAVAAFAARDAARESTLTAQQAARALGLHMRPTLEVAAVRDPDGVWRRVRMEVRNVGAFTASDVVLTVVRTDGARSSSGEPARLATGEAVFADVQPTYPAGPRGWQLAIASAVVRYSDESGAATWERRYEMGEHGWLPVTDLPVS